MDKQVNFWNLLLWNNSHIYADTAEKYFDTDIIVNKNDWYQYLVHPLK